MTETYEFPILTRWQKFKARYIPWKLRCLLHWVWYGHEFWPLAQWAKWKGVPPCRIARLWRKPQR